MMTGTTLRLRKQIGAVVCAGLYVAAGTAVLLMAGCGSKEEAAPKNYYTGPMAPKAGAPKTGSPNTK